MYTALRFDKARLFAKRRYYPRRFLTTEAETTLKPVDTDAESVIGVELGIEATAAQFVQIRIKSSGFMFVCEVEVYVPASEEAPAESSDVVAE